MQKVLSQLYIENVAGIEKSEIHFNAGLNVLTGETGAGKSIVIDAIHTILGQRASRDMIRTGSPSAFVSASFTGLSQPFCEFLTELGYAAEEGTLFLQRSVSIEGKGSCRINGRPAPVSVLKEIGLRLINIHGQNESYALLSPERHIAYLDGFGNNSTLLEEYRKQYLAMCAVRRELRALTLDDSEKMRRMDLLQFQIEELTNAQICIGEQEALQEKKIRYANSGKIASSLQEAISAISGEDEGFPGAQQALETASRCMQEAARYDNRLADLASRLVGFTYDLDDCTREMRDAGNGIEFDPAELEQVERRLDELYRLERKYGKTEEETLEYLANAEAELANIAFSEQRRESLEQDYQRCREEEERLARELSETRRQTAKLFSKRVREELAFLDMPHVRLQVEQKRCPLNETGGDEIQFLISTNPGEPPKPLAKIASGGELSRMMLAIKNVLADSDQIDTLIFDEVDTGISGSAAQKVGLKLKEVSRNRQVICVTHLAQIAALADEHLLIQKKVRDGRTFTAVFPLDFEGRKREIARIIGGVKITGLTLESAREMLEMAGFRGEKA